MSPTSRLSVKRYRLLVFAALATSYMLVTFHRLCPAVVAVDMMRDLDAGGGLVGMLAGASFYSYALMQLPAGLLADSWGARRTTSLFFCVAALGALLLGFSPSVSWAMAGRILVGVGTSMIFVSSLKTLAEWYPPGEFAAMTGLLVAFGGMGSLLATAPLAWSAQAFGWRGAFMAVGCVTLLLAALLWIVVRDTPAQAGYSGSEVPHELPPGRLPLMPGVKTVLANRWFWLFALWSFIENGIFFSFAGLWGGPYLSHVHAMTSGEAGQALLCIAVGLIVGGPFISLLSTNLLKGRKPALIFCATVLSLLTGLLAFRTASLSWVELLAILFFMGAFVGTAPVVAFTAVKELFPVRLAGTAIGLMNIFPFFGGAVFQPVLGSILEAAGRAESGAFTVAGYQQAFFVLFVASLATLGVCLLLKETLVRPARPIPLKAWPDKP